MDKVVFNTRDITGNKKVKVELELEPLYVIYQMRTHMNQIKLLSQ